MGLKRDTRLAKRVTDVHVPERGGFKGSAILNPTFYPKSVWDPDERLQREKEYRASDYMNMGMGRYFPTDRRIIEACHRALDEGRTQYLDYLPQLNEALVVKFAEENNIHDLDPMLSILVVGSCETAISLAALALLDPGDEALVFDPDYMRHTNISRLVGASSKWVPMAVREEDGDFYFDAGALEAAITPRTRVLWLTNPTNPSGYLFSRKDCEAIAELAKRHDFWVVTNELYDRVTYDGLKHFSIASLPGMLDRTLIVGGPSKNYDMTGFRMGWIVGSKDVMGQITDLMFYGCHGRPSSIGQYATLAAMSEPVRTDYIKKVLPIYEKNREMTADMLNSIPGVKCPKPMGGVFMFPDFSQLTEDDFGLVLYVKEEAHCSINTGFAWGFKGKGHVRFGLANTPEYQEEGLRRIEKALRKRFSC